MGQGQSKLSKSYSYYYNKNNNSGSGSGATTAKNAKDRLKNFKVISWSEAQQIKAQLNQNGVNEGIYVGTSDSFSINAYWRQQAGGQPSGWVSLPENKILRVTKEVDSWMKPLPESIQTIRAVGDDWLKDNFGTTDKSDIANIINNGNVSFKDAGFFSMSTDANRNIFTDRGVILHLGVPKGTKAFITSNRMESEIVGHRNTSTDFLGAEIVRARDTWTGRWVYQLHIYGITH